MTENLKMINPHFQPFKFDCWKYFQPKCDGIVVISGTTLLFFCFVPGSNLGYEKCGLFFSPLFSPFLPYAPSSNLRRKELHFFLALMLFRQKP